MYTTNVARAGRCAVTMPRQGALKHATSCRSRNQRDPRPADVQSDKAPSGGTQVTRPMPRRTRRRGAIDHLDPRFPMAAALVTLLVASLVGAQAQLTLIGTGARQVRCDARSRIGPPVDLPRVAAASLGGCGGESLQRLYGDARFGVVH